VINELVITIMHKCCDMFTIILQLSAPSVTFGIGTGYISHHHDYYFFVIIYSTSIDCGSMGQSPSVGSTDPQFLECKVNQCLTPLFHA